MEAIILNIARHRWSKRAMPSRPGPGLLIVATLLALTAGPARAEAPPSALDQIELRLATPLSPDEAQALTVRLIAIKTQALDCPAEDTAPAMPPAPVLVPQQPTAPEPSDDRPGTRPKSCAADIERADRLLGNLRETRRAALVDRLSTRDPSLSGLIGQIGKEPLPNLRTFYEARRPLPPATPWGWTGFFVCMGLGLLTGRTIGRRVEGAIVWENHPESRDLRWPAWAASVSLSVCLFYLERAAGATHASDLAWLTRILWTLAALLTADRLLRLWSASRLSGTEGRRLTVTMARRSGWLLLLFSLGYGFRLAVGHQDAALLDLVGLCLRSLALIAATALMSVTLEASFGPGRARVRQAALALGLGAVILIDLGGYHTLVQFLLQGSVGTVACFLIYGTINRIADALLTGADPRQQTVWGALGIRPLPGLRHAVWLRLLLVLIALLMLAAGLMTVWGFGETARAILTDRLVNGFQIGGVRVVPSRFLNAIGVLVVLLIVAQLLRRGAFGRWMDNSQLDPGAREAILRTTEYGGLALAILASFSWTGVGIQNTALMAGALSVGLGFGLQGLLANIVAGGTLLLERSVRPGDWIEITGPDGDRTQGRVKAVRARATEIQTLGYAEVIVPNADLVSRPLTNHTLRNTQGRIVLAFDMPHGLDAAAVITALMQQVGSHQALEQNGEEAPVIQLRSIENERLRFELQASVTDFWKAKQVESDLNLILYRAMADLFAATPQPLAAPRTAPHRPGTEGPENGAETARG